MLFQLKIKLAKTYFLAVVFSLLINEASAAQTTNHDLRIHGFIAQGLINVVVVTLLMIAVNSQLN
tara:strand:- start:725 stop:919 length:195 start_codon:yes stop_codon:yes gene_type:complete